MLSTTVIEIMAAAGQDVCGSVTTQIDERLCAAQVRARGEGCVYRQCRNPRKNGEFCTWHENHPENRVKYESGTMLDDEKATYADFLESNHSAASVEIYEIQQYAKELLTRVPYLVKLLKQAIQHAGDVMDRASEGEVRTIRALQTQVKQLASDLAESQTNLSALAQEQLTSTKSGTGSAADKADIERMKQDQENSIAVISDLRDKLRDAKLAMTKLNEEVARVEINVGAEVAEVEEAEQKQTKEKNSAQTKRELAEQKARAKEFEKKSREERAAEDKKRAEEQAEAEAEEQRQQAERAKQAEAGLKNARERKAQVEAVVPMDEYNMRGANGPLIIVGNDSVLGLAENPDVIDRKPADQPMKGSEYRKLEKGRFKISARNPKGDIGNWHFATRSELNAFNVGEGTPIYAALSDEQKRWIMQA